MSKQVNSYMIPIAGLSVGIHDYQYDITDDFFEIFDYSEVKKGIVKLNLTVEKQETMFVFTFNFKGKVQLPCDRCNDEYEQTIENTAELFLKYGSQYHEESDDVIVITKDQSEFDISSLIYEYIILSLPIHRTHPDVAQCNQEVIKYLEKAEIKEDNDSIDPRWKCLEDLKTDNDIN